LSVEREMEKVVCSKCGGKGKDEGEWLCSKCLGEGKLDWVENVVGKSGFRINGMYLQEVENYFYLEYSEPWCAAGFKRNRQGVKVEH